MAGHQREAGGRSRGRIAVRAALAVLVTGFVAAGPAWGEAPSPASPSSPADPAAGVAPSPEPPRIPETLARVWQGADGSLDARADRVLREMRRRGVWDLDPAARYVLWFAREGSELERARTAAALAPTLPAAQAALARARLLERGDLPGAAGAAAQALRALHVHLEASLWLAATAAVLGVGVVAAAGIGFLLLAGLSVLRHAGHDLGDALDGRMPPFARAALLGSVLLAPAALGEGILGGLLALFGVTFTYARGRRRLALAAAAAAILLAVYPGTGAVARALGALGADPVAQAAFGAERGQATPIEMRRLARAGSEDWLAARARALEDKRQGQLQLADARYRSILDAGESSPGLLNNAANVRLALGRAEEAIALYERAIEGAPGDALLWFNLAQAYGRALRVDEHDAMLAHAQELDEDRIRELTAALLEVDGLYVADLPVSADEIWTRILVPPRPPAAATLRGRIAPGLLGRHPAGTAAAWVGVGLAAWLIGRRFRPSRRCRACGERICPRCSTRLAAGNLCAACSRVLHRPETADPSLRSERLERLRRRLRRQQRAEGFLSVLVPGFAGLQGDRPLGALAALVAFAGAVGSILAATRVVPDPLSVGGAAWILFGTLAAAAALAYGGLTGWALLRGRS